MKSLIKLLLIPAVSLVLGACASTKDPNATNPENVSNIPWNKPQSWEGGGALGGAMGGR